MHSVQELNVGTVHLFGLGNLTIVNFSAIVCLNHELSQAQI